MSCLLFVLAEPGAEVTLDEFQDWYNNEHVPIRMNVLSSFLTGARFSAADNSKPSWLACYDITSPEALQQPEYTKLRANRSPREADLVKRLHTLDRRTYVLVADSGESKLTSGFGADRPTHCLATVGLEAPSEDSFSEAVHALFKDAAVLSQWVRSRAYKLVDGLKTGAGVPEGPEAQQQPQYLIVHELLDPQAMTSPVLRQVGLGITLQEDRTWQLYRAYPGIAQDQKSS